MSVLHAYNVSYQFSNGDTLFCNLNFTLTQRRTALVGDNGVGKSILGKLLAKQLTPSQGSIEQFAQVAIQSQEAQPLLKSDMTIAQLLGCDKTLAALAAIARGECEQTLFDAVAEQWQLPEQLSAQLATLGLTTDPHAPCNTLSGGQLARLRLWQLFNSNAKVLILDEPSNHLDNEGRAWLIEQINHFTGYILLISHDHQLLEHVTHIWELSSLGLKQYGGNIGYYLQQKHQQQQSLNQQLQEVKRQQTQLKLQAQKDREKAHQRAAQSNKLRVQGSQAKIMLNNQKDQAGAHLAAKQKNQQQREKKITTKAEQLRLKSEQNNAIQFYLREVPEHTKVKKTLVSLVDLQLPFGSTSAITVQVKTAQKWHIKGNNGCGKSTLFRVLQNHLKAKSGELRVNTPLSYVDQHFSLLPSQLSVIQVVEQNCPAISKSDCYTLLAGIGLKHKKVEQPVASLSGGEKMKLTLLCASHQQATPLLLLDEPDNHLDLGSKQQLAKALNQYKGSFLLISHNDCFVKHAGVTHTLAM
ncbi:ABC-F family ATP-binding cassette domain-containing protein [Pseudoalteromonas sp. JBTF-M23]|uniref:ABC-F family ATP-binding cassette domain-containing protein n=1 Tax=Pseudoalteromonas caenipelagi TaxID=2726988 RepID=A0A849VAZ5_9GAMM|nr:ATP-binding cassette domain-containing protein [Pseudoalteromonas caenipelagi]NOU50456.1 ABC-F family ATP-binding cassette domain-containing protein [Pseudoalteromonas caenipelagi]